MAEILKRESGDCGSRGTGCQPVMPGAPGSAAGSPRAGSPCHDKGNRFRFQITPDVIDPAALQSKLRDGGAGAGACVSFEGRVRDASHGRTVVALEYEAFAPLAEKEGARILAGARARFGLLGAVCAHRTGRLAPGELAVWIGVACAHRGAAFDACRFIIDEVKARVPVWKKEFYADGEKARWLRG